MRRTSRAVAVALILLGLSAATGCVLLSPENRALYAELQAEGQAIAEDGLTLAAELKKVKEDLAQIRLEVKEGRLVEAAIETKDLVASYMARQEEFETLIEENKERGKAVAAKVRQVHASGVPMWQAVLLGLLNVGIGAYAAKQKMNADTASAMTSAVVGGIEKIYAPVKMRVLSGVENEADKKNLTLLKQVKGEVEKAAERKGVGTELATLVEDQT